MLKFYLKGSDKISNIKPVSELRNYSSLLESVSPGEPLYLTKNGHGAYAVVDIADQEEAIRLKATIKFMCEMNKGIQSGEQEGWLSIEQVRAHMRERRNEL